MATLDPDFSDAQSTSHSIRLQEVAEGAETFYPGMHFIPSIPMFVVATEAPATGAIQFLCALCELL
jgi:hypothetical protein